MSGSTPTWARVALVFMGACTPGGFLFLIALLTTSNIDMPPSAWFGLALVGAVIGFLLPRAWEGPPPPR